MEPLPQMVIDLKIGETEFKRNLNDDLQIDESNINDGLINQPSLYAYYALRLQEATALRDEAEFEHDKIIDEMMQVVREELVSSKAKVTEASIKSIVNTRDEVVAWKKIYLKRAANRDKLYSLVKALEHKMEALKSVAFKQRNEIDAMSSSTIYNKKRTKIPTSGIEDDED